jgi:type II secretory pathway pseudopilin PulG
MSLIELLIVIGLLGILLAGAATTSARLYTSLLLRGAVEQVQLVLERAYILALLSESPVHVRIEPTRISFCPRADTCEHAALAPTITLRSNTAARTVLTFYPSHATSPATLTVQGLAGSCRVVLSLRGRVSTSC